MRFILMIAFIAAIGVLAMTLIGGMQRAAETAMGEYRKMPETFKRVAYVVLIVLLFGLASGWLGAA